MEYDDIIYLSLLFFSIGFGYVYQKIGDKETKKLVGTAVGLGIVLTVSGLHIAHHLITVIVNAAIILFLDKRKCHLYSFGFSFLYLFFFRTTLYFGIPYPPGHTNLVQMMLTLKLVSLAFDINLSHQRSGKSDGDNKTEEEKLEDESNVLVISFADIFHYAFNYIGVLTGPFIRYRTFRDYFDLPFAQHADWKRWTLQKLKLLPMFAILFLVSSHYYPFSYAKSDEFYNDRSWLYRLWYIWPSFFIFRMRIYIGLILSEIVCTVAGLGAYPAASEPRCGHGPTKNFRELNEMIKSPAKLEAADYNFETIHNVNPKGAEFEPTFRETMKHWNMCIQYWMATCVYKRFPSKKYRTFATMFVSALWHGVYTGYYVCLCGAPFVLPIDAVFSKLVREGRTGMTLHLANIVSVIFKMFFFAYLSIAFHLMTVGWIMHYYNSVYHAAPVFGVLFYVGGTYALKLKKARARKLADRTEPKLTDKKID